MWSTNYGMVVRSADRGLDTAAAARGGGAWNQYKFLLQDRDSIFASHLDESIRRLGLRVLKSPPRCPKANGTFARDILSRFLIDLSWASSRLEGNTYSRLDTERLIQFGQEAEGKDANETQTILNHKAAFR